MVFYCCMIRLYSPAFARVYLFFHEWLQLLVIYPFRCNSDDSDYVEVGACNHGEFLTLPTLQYCHSQPSDRPISIRWNNPCMKIKFHSKSFIVRRGFLATYSFHLSGNSVQLLRCVLEILCTSRPISKSEIELFMYGSRSNASEV